MDETPESDTADDAADGHLLFEEAVTGTCRLDFEPHAEVVTFEGIRPVVEAYDRNFTRVLRLLCLPVHMFDMGQDWVHSYRNAKEKLFPDGPPDLEDEEEMKAAAEALSELASDMMGQVYLGGEDVEEIPEEESSRRFERSVENVSSMLDDFADDLTEDGITALYAAALMQTWTSFEALAKDLWIAALNSRPRLGFIAINAKYDPGDEEEDEGSGKHEFEVPTRILRDPKFVLHDNMGTLLRDKFRFQKRDGAAKAYVAVFGKNHDRITAAFFSDEIRWLWAIRNNLVHKAGRADEEFRRWVRRHPLLSEVGEEQPLPLDGALVSELIAAVNARSRDLILFVNDWLVANPR